MREELTSLVLPFGGIELDRAGHFRTDSERLAAMLGDPSSKMLEIVAGQVPIDADGCLVWSVVDRESPLESIIFLGLDSDRKALFSVDRGDIDPVERSFFHLRDVGAGLPAVDAAAALEAVAITTWHRRHRYCAVCGTLTEVIEAGHTRHCPQCDALHYPRMDPAVIMLVSDGERCVLGRRPGAPLGRWSTLAGYVEPGETLEAAVKREVEEEVGLVVKRVHYRGSQPWPFPSSLMLAFTAEADFAPLSINDEHQEAGWFTHDDLRTAFEKGTMTFPSSTSAGHHLIQSFLG